MSQALQYMQRLLLYNSADRYSGNMPVVFPVLTVADRKKPEAYDCFRCLVCPAGFEPVTFRVGV